MIEVSRYTEASADAWNTFVANSANGTFLFDRRFMDYHSDRFKDNSLLFHDNGTLVAILPANRSGRSLMSHGGLTYGGVVHGPRLSGAKVLEVFEACSTYALSEGLSSILYKTVPTIYHSVHSEQDRYALFRCGARRIRSDLSTAVRLDGKVHVSKLRRRGKARADKAGVEVRTSMDWDAFWGLLNTVLGSRHGVSAVHSLDEIRFLAEKFPAAINLYVAEGPDGELLAGAVVFDTGTTVHTQYLANSQQGRDIGALDAVILHLVGLYQPTHKWLDFGISTESGGQILNAGLLRQKEMFGGTSVVYEHYQIELS